MLSLRTRHLAAVNSAFHASVIAVVHRVGALSLPLSPLPLSLSLSASLLPHQPCASAHTNAKGKRRQEQRHGHSHSNKRTDNRSYAGAQRSPRNAAGRSAAHQASHPRDPHRSHPPPHPPPNNSARPPFDDTQPERPRSGYRHGAERDARGKHPRTRQARRVGGVAARVLSALDSDAVQSDLDREALRSAASSIPFRAPLRPSPVTMEEAAEVAEEEARMGEELIEPTHSSKEFWENFPIERELREEQQKGGRKKTATHTTPSQPRPTPHSYETSASASSTSYRAVVYDPRFERDAYKPEPDHEPETETVPSPTPADESAPSAPVFPPAATRREVRRTAHQEELHEALSGGLPSVQLHRGNVRVGVLLPNMEHDVTNAADERTIQAEREELYGRCQEIATQTGLPLINHPLQVDMMLKFVHPADRTTSTPEQQSSDVAADDASSPSSSFSSSTPTSASTSHTSSSPILQLIESNARPLTLRKGQNLNPNRGLGQSFFVNFHQYWDELLKRGGVAEQKEKTGKVKGSGSKLASTKEDEFFKPIVDSPLIKAIRWGMNKNGSLHHGITATVSSADSSTTSFLTDATHSSSISASSSTPSSSSHTSSHEDEEIRSISQLPQPLSGLTVVDATAGFAVDAFTMATLGARVVAFENFPPFHLLLSQGLNLIQSDSQLHYLRDRLTIHHQDSREAMIAWNQVLMQQEQQQQETQADVNDAATADSPMSSVATCHSFTPPLPSRPDIVYIDLYARSGRLARSPGQMPFSIQVRSRYLKLLCDLPTPHEVNALLDAGLQLARNHVVMKFPRTGAHYRPGDEIAMQETQDEQPSDTDHPAQDQQQQLAWNVERIYRQRECEYVVYTRKAQPQ